MKWLKYSIGGDFEIRTNCYRFKVNTGCNLYNT
jgi:hypothetical protein